MADPVFSNKAFALEIRLAMATDNISYRDLAALTGCDQANIHRVAKKALSPSVETYLRLRQWLNQRNTQPKEGE